MDTLERNIQDWRHAAAGEAYFSASRVQSQLFELYGDVVDQEAKRLVEMWLTLTVQRDLFSGSEILELLDDLEMRISRPVNAG